MDAMNNKKILAPELRFKEFDKEWKNKKLGELVFKMQSGVSRKLNDTDVGFPILRSNNIQNGKLDVTDIKYWYLIDEQGANLQNYILKKNDILVNFINSLAQIGKVAIFEDLLKRDTIFTTNILRLCIQKSTDSVFIYYNFNTKKYADFVQSITKPAVNQASFTTKEFQNYPIACPSLPEQQKIASFLSAVDEKIKQLTRKKELLEQYKKGVMQQLFSGKLRFKDENGKAFPKWDEKKIKDVLEIGSGRDYKHLGYGDIPVFGTGGLMTTVNEFLYDGETVCIGRKGTIDKPMYYNGKIWTVDTLFYTHKFNDSIPKFIYYLFQQINWKLYNEASGVPSLSKATIEKIKLSFPPRDEQKKIADYLSNIDSKIEIVNKQITQTQTFKKGLLQQMFV